MIEVGVIDDSRFRDQGEHFHGFRPFDPQVARPVMESSMMDKHILVRFDLIEKNLKADITPSLAEAFHNGGRGMMETTCLSVN